MAEYRRWNGINTSANVWSIQRFEQSQRLYTALYKNIPFPPAHPAGLPASIPVWFHPCLIPSLCVRACVRACVRVVPV